MKKTITLFMALALVTSMFAMPHNPKQFILGKQKIQTEQKLNQHVPAKKSIARKAVQASAFSFVSSVPAGWTVSPTQAGFESKELARGMQMTATTTITYAGAEDVSSIVVTGSTNGDGNTISVKVGTTDFGSASLTKGDRHQEYKFSGTKSSGNVVITVTRAASSIWIESVSLDGTGGGGGGEEEVTISGLTQAYAYYYEDSEAYYWDFDLAAEFGEEDTTYPELYFMCDDEASSKTSIVGTYAAYYAMVWTSAKDSVGTDEDEPVGTITVTYVEEGVYNFEGSFEGTDGKTYKWNATNVVVAAYDADNDEEIELDETGGGKDIYTISEAKTAYDGGVIKDNDSIYIKGYISNMFLKPTNFAKYGSVSIWLAEEEGGTAKEFELYNCYGLDGDTLTSFSPDTTGSTQVDVTTVSSPTCSFSVGDYVEAAGMIKLYGTTYELTSGCYLTKIVPAAGGDTTKIENVDGLEIDYYPSYSSEGAYDYTFLLYNSEDEDYLPMVAFDILTATEKSFTGTYTMQGGTLTEYSYYVYGTGDDDYMEFTDGEITITDNGNNSYTIKGWFTDGTKVYLVEKTLDGEYFNADYPYEPEEKTTLNLVVTGGEEDNSYVSDYGIIDIYLTTADGEVTLEYVLGSSESVTAIPDGTYPIEAADYDEEGSIQQTYGFFDAGYYYSSYGVAVGSTYQTDEEIYYLVSGTVKVETVEGGKKVTLTGTTYYGSTIKAEYIISGSTALREAAASMKMDGKYLMNGQFVILKNNVLYNAQGQVIK